MRIVVCVKFVCACRCQLVVCEIYVSAYVVLFFIPNEMHMYVYVYGWLNILVFVSGYLFACAYRKNCSDTVNRCQPRQFGLAFLGPPRPARLRL